jgi:hypothetical protein
VEFAILFAFLAVTHPICIFLDGLDEINEDDSPTDLLDLIFQPGALPTVKVCISSRPEPIFKRRLKSTPHLRVQDLTRVDMEKYVEDKLKPNVGLTKEELCNLIRDVCSKADGVFLWVTLAVKSLPRGLSSEETIAELSKRLGVLPNSLQQLYEQMWQRLNEDKISYQEDATLYIYFALEFPDKINSKIRTESNMPYDEIALPLTIFHIMAATDLPFTEEILGNSKVSSTEEVQQKCNRTSKRVEARTAGLLEVDPANGVISFIHRSSIEFFQSTEAGHKILESVKLSLSRPVLLHRCRNCERRGQFYCNCRSFINEYLKLEERKKERKSKVHVQGVPYIVQGLTLEND